MLTDLLTCSRDHLRADATG